MPALVKRSDTEIPPELIVLIVMIAAAFLVCCGFAIHKAFGLDDGNTFKPMSQEQEQYMVDVRMRNLKMLEYEGMMGRIHGRERSDAG